MGPILLLSRPAMKRVKAPISLPGVVTASRDVPGGHRIDIELETERDRVPAILVVPDRALNESRCAAALLLHGFTSRKERMAEGIGQAARREFWSSSCVDRTPATTPVTAGCAGGNCSAAAARGTPKARQCDSIASTRVMTSGLAGA